MEVRILEDIYLTNSQFIDSVAQKYETSSLITPTDLSHLETYWLDALRQAKAKIVARVCTNLQTTQWADTSFDLRKEDQE
jgi:hypothetical protein